MAHVMNIPFQSYNRLRNWHQNCPDNRSEFHAKCLDAYYEGMRTWLENMPATIRVFDYPSFDERRRVEYTDVQFELPLGDGASSQMYLMTLVTPRFAYEEKEFASEGGPFDFDFGVPLSQVNDPFGQPTVIWECTTLDTKEVLKAVRAWSAKFWPDFECEYVFGQIEESVLERQAPQPEDCKVLLQCDPCQVEGIQNWAVEQGCHLVSVSQNHMILLGDLPITALTSIRSNWPNLPFVVESFRLVGQF